MHAIEAAGFAIVQDDDALIDRRPSSRFWPKLRSRLTGLATAAVYALIVAIALLGFVRSRLARRFSPPPPASPDLTTTSIGRQTLDRAR